MSVHSRPPPPASDGNPVTEDPAVSGVVGEPGAKNLLLGVRGCPIAMAADCGPVHQILAGPDIASAICRLHLFAMQRPPRASGSGCRFEQVLDLCPGACRIDRRQPWRGSYRRRVFELDQMVDDPEDLAAQPRLERLAQTLDLLGQIFPVEKLVRAAARSGAQRRRPAAPPRRQYRCRRASSGLPSTAPVEPHRP